MSYHFDTKISVVLNFYFRCCMCCVIFLQTSSSVITFFFFFKSQREVSGDMEISVLKLRQSQTNNETWSLYKSNNDTKI